MAILMMRYMVLYFINTGTEAEPVWSPMNKGFTKLDESPNPQVESKTYIGEKTASPSIKNYEPSFPFEADLWNGEAGVMALYQIARDRKVGSEAIVDVVATDFTVSAEGQPVAAPTARRMKMAVEVSDMVTGEGGELLSMSGNLNQVGDAEEGYFKLATKTWSTTAPTQ